MSPREQARIDAAIEQMTPPPGDEIDGYPELDCTVEHDGALMTVRYIVRERWGQPEISGVFHGCLDLLKEAKCAPAWAYAAAAQDILDNQREAEEARAEMFEATA